MSVERWRYRPICDYRYCPGDCDRCSFEPIEGVEDRIETTVHQFMLVECGFSKSEINDYCVIDFDDFQDSTGYGYKIEVRAEVDYNDLTRLCELLDPIVKLYDEGSYFEPVNPGIIEAYLWE